MDTYLIWLIAGFLLVIVELVSGTFYLLVLGIASPALAEHRLNGWLKVGALKSVRKKPGAIALTHTLFFASSSASVRVSPMIPILLAA